MAVLSLYRQDPSGRIVNMAVGVNKSSSHYWCLLVHGILKIVLRAEALRNEKSFLEIKKKVLISIIETFSHY